jgi:hypothetical protein
MVNLPHLFFVISQAVAASHNDGSLSAESISNNIHNDVRDTEAIPRNRFRFFPSNVLNIADLDVMQT